MIDQPKNSSPCHVTLNSSGGIALGAFMAGVFFEIIKEALEEKYFVVDIITGASAGAMTGTIASHLLLNDDKEAFEKQEDNPLYEAWVNKADMEAIDSVKVMPKEELEVFWGIKGKEKHPLGILSGKAIQEISEVVQKTPKVSRPLALLMTVTNVQGFLIQNKYSNSKSVSSAEVRQFFFYPGREIEPEFDSLWEKVVIGSRASGAFPVAFPPIEDLSSPNSTNFKDLSRIYFKDEVLDESLPIVEDQKLKFLYTDGGVLDNLPILKGIKIEADLAGNPIEFRQDEYYHKFKSSLYENYPELDLDRNSSQANSSKRLHVFVQPNPASHLQSPKRLLKTTFTLLEMLLGGLTLPHEEHDATQLRQLLDLKQKVELKQEILKHLDATDPNNGDFRKKLQELIPYESINLSPITPLILRQIKNPTDIQNMESTSVDLNKLKQRLGKLDSIYNALTEYDIFKEFLREGNPIPDPADLLASDFIRAFGGFFDRKYREHDFLLGRICGLTWIYLNFDVEETDTSKKHVEELLQEVSKKRGKILASNPDVKLSYRIRLFRIFLRFLRIVTLESQPSAGKDGRWNPWNLLYFPLAILAVVVLRLAELIATILLWILATVRW